MSLSLPLKFFPRESKHLVKSCCGDRGRGKRNSETREKDPRHLIVETAQISLPMVNLVRNRLSSMSPQTHLLLSTRVVVESRFEMIAHAEAFVAFVAEAI